jgi:hypothetical protein
LTPDFDAVQVLRTEVAVKGPAPTFLTEAELVTDRLPLVLTVMAPDGPRGAFGSLGGLPPKTTAGPYWARAPSSSVALTALDDPPAGKVTEGLELPGKPAPGFWPHPRTCGGPPNRPIFV